MMKTDGRGLYVHIPFCVRKCNYCDFCSFNMSEVGWRNDYIDALCKEIESYMDRNIAIDSIFFGGGTPSLLTPVEFEKICSAINRSFVVLPDTEFTVEANPKTLDRAKLTSLMGVLYILDEPENSLSSEYQIDLSKFIESMARFYNCQFIISSHSPFFLSMKGAKIYDLDAQPTSVKKWTEIPNMRLLRDFFADHNDEFQTR